MRRAIGNTTTMVGKATSHESSQAFSQRPCQFGAKPIALIVEMQDTTIVINPLRTSGIAIALYRGESFCI